jgi:hypothetical protein
MQNMLINTSFSNDNYNNLLIHWASQSNIQKNVTFDVNKTTKCTIPFAKTARDTLINAYSWKITDGEESSSSDKISTTTTIKSTRKSNFFSMKTLTTDNSRIYYKPGSLSIGSNGVSNSRLKSRKT